MSTPSTLGSRLRWTPEFRERMRKQRALTGVFIFLVLLAGISQFELDIDVVLPVFLHLGMAATMGSLCLYTWIKCLGPAAQLEESKLDAAT